MRVRSLRWLAILAAALALPAQAAAPPFAEQHATLDAELAQAVPVKTMPERFEITAQGLAELMDVQGTVVERGWVSPRGWVLECRPLGRYLRQWVDDGHTLTRAYIGASWLEYWGVFCKPSQDGPWSDADVKRLARAATRAADAWPAAWDAAKPLYAYPKSLAYLQALNQEGGIAVPDRACVRALVADARTGQAPFERAVATWARVCPTAPGHVLLEDGAVQEALYDTPLATAMASPFLGLARWSAEPNDLARGLSRPNANLHLMADLMRVMPLAERQVERQEAWARGVAREAAGKSGDALKAQARDEMNAQASPEDGWVGLWPTADECTATGAQLRAAAQAARSVPALQSLLHQITLVALTCPAIGWTPADRDWLAAAFARTAQGLPGSWRDARQALGADPAAAQADADRWLADHAQQAPRTRCLQAEMAAVRAEGDVQGVGWLAARGRCPAAYQTRFLTDGGLQ